MKHPFLHVALWYVAGIVFARYFDLPVGLLAALGLLASVLGFLFSRHSEKHLAVALFFAAWMNHDWRTQIVSPHDLRVELREVPVLATVTGTLLEEPVVKKHTYNGTENWSSHVLVNVETVSIDGKSKPSSGIVLARHSDLLPEEFTIGAEVSLFGVLNHPPTNRVPGLFNYRKHLQQRGVYFTLETELETDWQLSTAPRSPFHFLRSFRTWARETLSMGIPADDGIIDLLQAMTLGWKAGLTSEVREPFMKSGTMHIFAISGLHIAMIGAILVELLRMCRLTKRQSACGVIVLLWCYVVATGEQPSAIRAAVMMTVILAGLVLKRPSNLLNSTAAAAFLILLFDPLSLFQIGFQLSFAVVATLALMKPRVDEWTKSICFSDPFLAPELQPQWNRAFNLVIGWTVGALAVSVSAWLGSLPLVALYFNYVTPGSLVANLAIIPISGLAIASVIGSWVTAAVQLTAVSEWFNWSAWFIMSVMVWLSDLIAGWNWTWWNVQSPDLFVVGFYYLILIVFGTGWPHRSRLRQLATGSAILVVLGSGFISNWLRPTASIWLLPNGGGHVVYVEKNGSTEELLIDSGDRYAYESSTQPWLRSRGINRLENFAVSHGDARHMAAAEDLLSEFSPARIITSHARSRSSYYRSLEDSLTIMSKRWEKVSTGNVIAGFEVLHPTAGSELMKADDVALVLHTTILGDSVLIMADPTIYNQESILSAHPDLKPDIVVVGIPATGENLSALFLSQLEPELVVLCSDISPASAIESQKLRSLADDLPFHFLFTSDMGGIEIELSESGKKVYGPQREMVWNSESKKPPHSESAGAEIRSK